MPHLCSPQIKLILQFIYYSFIHRYFFGIPQKIAEHDVQSSLLFPPHAPAHGHTGLTRLKYCEDKKLAVLFFFVYYFLKFCLRENLLTLDQANALNKKLFEHYFRKSIMYFTNNDEPDCNSVSKDEVIDVITAMLKGKYDSIPNQRPENGTPCKINTRNSEECIVFRKDKFLNEFADWLEKSYPEEAANIDLVRKYISQTDDSHNIIRKAMYEKNLLHTTSGKNYYKLSNVSYVAFLSDKVLKNDLCLEI